MPEVKGHSDNLLGHSHLSFDLLCFITVDGHHQHICCHCDTRVIQAKWEMNEILILMNTGSGEE